MKIIENLEQGSQEWLLFRQNHVGASDASTIMGINPWRTKKQLWEEKVLGWSQEINANMKRGQLMEKDALYVYQALTKYSMAPLVVEDLLFPFLSASFDGISECLNRVVEIKCGKNSHKLAHLGKIPDYYYAQMQHQMFIANVDEMDYFSFDGQQGILMPVERNNIFIYEMLEKEIEFWHCVTQFTPPKD